MRWIAVLMLVLGLLLIPVVVRADTADVTVTAQGYICAEPGNFTLTYVSDYEIGISWKKGEDAVNTMVRAAFGRLPEDRTDGYQVYYGDGTSCTDTALSLATPEIVYYKAWSQNADGQWSELFASADTEGFMSASFLFIGLIGLAGMLTYFAWRRRHVLICMAASVSWLALGTWLFFGDVTNLQLEETWTQLIGWVFIMMTFACLLFLMDVEIQYEARGRKWTEYGEKPRERPPRSYEEYARRLRERLRR